MILSDLIKRSFTLSRHRTSIALEPEFWDMLKIMAQDRSLASLIASIDARRPPERPLASALRVAALRYACPEPRLTIGTTETGAE